MIKLPFLLNLITGVLLSTSLIASDNIFIENEGLYPEGVSFNSNNQLFYVSSVAKGEVWTVDLKGNSELFVKDRRFASTIGLQVDRDRNRIIICVADPGVGVNSRNAGKVAGVAIFDLTSKMEIAYYDLTPVNSQKNHFANDVTIDDNGNIYVTDSFSPNIYKVNTRGSTNLFAEYSNWKVKPGRFGLNGIAFHPKGFLIAAHYDSGKLYKIDVDNPSNINEITFNQVSEKWKISGFDGLLFQNNFLYAVNNDTSDRENGNVVYRITSDNNWKSAKLVSAAPTSNTYPTTLTSAGNNIFVLHSNLMELFSGNKSPVNTFEIEKVVFENIN